MISSIAQGAFCLYAGAVAFNSLRQTAGYPPTAACLENSGENHEVFQSFVDQMAPRMGIHKPVKLMQSENIVAALGIGRLFFLQAVIAIPQPDQLKEKTISVLGDDRVLSLEEAKVCLLHELAHIRNNDHLYSLLPLISSIVIFTLSRKRFPISGSILSLFSIPFLSKRIQRWREKEADITAAAFASKELALAGKRLFEYQEAHLSEMEKYIPSIRLITMLADPLHPPPKERARIYTDAYNKKTE